MSIVPCTKDSFGVSSTYCQSYTFAGMSINSVCANAVPVLSSWPAQVKLVPWVTGESIVNLIVTILIAGWMI